MMKYRLSPHLITTSLLFFLFSIQFVSAQEISKDPAAVTAGEALFKANCKSCHKVKEKLVGPALGGVEGRVPSIQWLKDWIHNSAKVVASGDEYGNKIYNEYSKSQMTAFTSLSDDQIMNILSYIKAENEKVVEVKPPTPGEQPIS